MLQTILETQGTYFETLSILMVIFASILSGILSRAGMTGECWRHQLKERVDASCAGDGLDDGGATRAGWTAFLVRGRSEDVATESSVVLAGRRRSAHEPVQTYHGLGSDIESTERGLTRQHTCVVDAAVPEPGARGRLRLLDSSREVLHCRRVELMPLSWLMLGPT